MKKTFHSPVVACLGFLLSAVAFAQAPEPAEQNQPPKLTQAPPKADPTEPAAQQSPEASTAVEAPDDPNLIRGVELLQAKQYPEAEEALRQALAAQPANPKVHFHLGVLFAQTGKLAEAETELNQAQELVNRTTDEKYQFLHQRGVVYARREKWASAVDDLQQAITLKPQEPYNHYYIGVAYNRIKRPDKMVEHLQMFLKLAPNAPEAPKCRALLRGL